MRYSYLHPFCPQFFFQAECIGNPFFLSFYQPYSYTGAISWLLWRNSKLYRLIFSKPNIEKYIPESLLRTIIGNNSILGINSGSPGPERKITVIGLQSDIPFFFKLAQTETAKKLVQNEYHILKYLDGNEFAPSVKEFITKENFFGLKTEFLNGRRLEDEKINTDIFNVIKKVSLLNLPGCNIVNSNLQISFAHGDFCPWNLMNVEGKLKVFDWEMGGYYPLGYDLFTYIFQTSFILHPKVKIEEIIKKNQHHFIKFFKKTDWNPYMASFAKIKFEKESLKNNLLLVHHYKQLMRYASKA